MGQKVPKRLSWSEGCLLGVQGPQLAVLGELQGLPKAADLWDELGPLKHLHPPLSRVRGYMEYLAEPLSPQAQVAYHPPWGAQAPAQGWPWAPPAGRAGAGGLRVCVPASVLRESSLCWFVYPSAEAAASVPSRRAPPGGACGCAASPVSCVTLHAALPPSHCNKTNWNLLGLVSLKLFHYHQEETQHRSSPKTEQRGTPGSGAS